MVENYGNGVTAFGKRNIKLFAKVFKLHYLVANRVDNHHISVLNIVFAEVYKFDIDNNGVITVDDYNCLKYNMGRIDFRFPS